MFATEFDWRETARQIRASVERWNVAVAAVDVARRESFASVFPAVALEYLNEQYE